MNNVNQDYNIKLIKNFIQDLSFENPHNLNDNNSVNNKIDFNTSVIFKPYNDNNFSLILKYTSLSVRPNLIIW